MYHPTTRVLTVLELLQSHPMITGAEIAQRLEIDIRTVRRYIAMIEELGIPVIADRGRHGGYRLMPGFKLPPLMFNDEEVLALTLGLLAVRRLGIVGQVQGVEGALAKVERVLPQAIRNRVRTIEETLVWDLGKPPTSKPDSDVFLTLATTVQECRRVTLHYRKSDTEETVRLFDPFGLVYRRGGCYTIGYCHLRDGLRLFRLDRVTKVIVHNDVFERPEGFDVLLAVQTMLGSVPRSLSVEVWLDTSLETARQHISVDVATLEKIEGGGVLLRGYTDDPDWFARQLARMGCRLIIHRPPELREALRRHATQLTLWADAVSW